MSAHLVEQTIQTYDEHAGTYDDETVEWWERFPEATLREFAGALRGRNVLSVGSGPGRDAERLREMGVEVTCLDASSAMVALTKMKGFDSRHARFEDAAKLFPPESFDGVWAFASLMHTPKEEAEAVIQDLHGLLKPGGIFAIGVLIGDSGENAPWFQQAMQILYNCLCFLFRDM